MNSRAPERIVHYIPRFNAPPVQLGDTVRFFDADHIVTAIEVLSPSVTKLTVTP